MLKRYALLKNYDNDIRVGVMTYDGESMMLDLVQGIDYDCYPIHFQRSVDKGVYHIGSEDVLSWVRYRIPPPSRQDLRDILKEFGLKRYDEFELFIAYWGKSVQDDYYLVEID